MTKKTTRPDPEKLKTRRRPYEITLCQGFSACPRSLSDPANDTASLAELKKHLSALSIHDPLSSAPHRPFSISVSLCPNGCSRPQIADIGITAAAYPRIDYSLCTGCAACVDVCRESALKIISEGRPDLHKACIGCGDCFASCPTGALEIQNKGFRILLGGKLGRHPHLAEDTGTLYNASQVLDRTIKWYTFWFKKRIPGERFRDLINRRGLP